jgi:ubiquinone/menaquinone biosynthesis C-methylase UbiE
MSGRPEQSDDDGLGATLEAWRVATLAKDVAAARRLRDEAYRLVLPSGGALTREQELAQFQSPEQQVTSIRIVEVRRGKGTAMAVLEGSVQAGAEAPHPFRWHVEFARRNDVWIATQSRVLDGSHGTPVPSSPRQTVTGWARKLLAQIRQPSFQRIAFLPYKPDEDFALPRTISPRLADSELPIPPPHLWLGYNYPIHGQTHVATMLRIVEASNFQLEAGDRILDFGCGAGRMIRNLHHLSAACEIWGVDLSSEHILWCRRNLSPPFKFATTTKVPHLPFADGSFRFIYCGSVFTHIDDLADAWLLELRRVLRPDGRLYVTIHDNHTVELIERARESEHFLGWVRSRPVYKAFKNNFDVISFGRDDRSQVFYDREYFCRMAQQTFDVLSVTPEAFFYQTAILLKPAQ